MSSTPESVAKLLETGYEHGFFTDIESDTVAPGINEDVIRFISAKKQEPNWMLEYRLKAFAHWQTLTGPKWAQLDLKPIDYQDISYYSAPRSKSDAPKSLDEIDPEILETYNKLGALTKALEIAEAL